MDNEKRQHILNTAMTLFNEYGFHGMPTSKIAKASGVCVGTLFNYFPTKEDLIIDIYKEIKGRSKHVFLDHLHEIPKDENPLRHMWHTVVEWGVESPEEFTYVGLFSHSPYKKVFKDEKMLESFTKMRETILSSLSPNNVCKQYPEYSMIYMNNALRATTNFIKENDVEDTEHFINASFDLFWSGFGPK